MKKQYEMSMNHMNPRNPWERNEKPKDDRLLMAVIALLLVPVVYFVFSLVWQAFSLLAA